MSSASSVQARQIRWYRTPVAAETLKALSRRSDLFGFVQTLSYLGLYALTAGAALYGWGIGAPHRRWPAAAIVLLVLAHGTVCAFMINGVHELGHGTVFKTRALNSFFLRVLAFLGWINFQTFGVSHMRHHAYTLHPPDDLEVVLPIKLMIRHFFKQGLVNFRAMWDVPREAIRIARGKFQTEWELILFPPENRQKRRPPVRWARVLLIGHGLIIATSLWLHLWLIPILFTLAPFYGGWLFFLCNNTQHIGLSDNVPDFRLCCRTFTLNPLVAMLYWRMNYHTEHHMYPTVPCYRLKRLHEIIEHDLPPTPHGIAATWSEILAILRRQEQDPTYQYVPPLPSNQPLTTVS